MGEKEKKQRNFLQEQKWGPGRSVIWNFALFWKSWSPSGCSRSFLPVSMRETALLPDGQEVFAIQQTSGDERLEEGESVYVCWNPNEAALVR